MTAGGAGYAVTERQERFHGPTFDVVTDRVSLPGGHVVARDYVRHIGSVAVVPVDAEGQVILVRQYRHPVRGEIWELPAGLRDVAGEDLAVAAARELAEETDLVAERWDVLLDLHTSPGCSDERIRIFLARDLAPAAQPHTRVHEEATMVVARFALDDAVWMALAGQITNAPCVAGVLAAARVRDAGWAPLRPADAAEPQSPPTGLQ